MRYPIAITPIWRPFFALFGWSRARSYAEIAGDELRLNFGTARERIPLAEIANVAPRRWPRYYGFGAKYGPNGGVSYVGSARGVVQIDFAHPRALNVWGPFRAAHARCAIVSLADAEQFVADLRGRIAREVAP
jgi:hypothetical protein